jgi:hypothetical protein
VLPLLDWVGLDIKGPLRVLVAIAPMGPALKINGLAEYLIWHGRCWILLPGIVGLVMGGAREW